jgi:hypothetical protein
VNRFFIAKLDHHVQLLQILVVHDTDESKPFNNFYRQSMENLRTVVRTVINEYFPR